MGFLFLYNIFLTERGTIKMRLITQHYYDDDGQITEFTDAQQFHHSVKVKAGDIKIISGTAKPSEIASDINRRAAMSKGRLVGFNR